RGDGEAGAVDRDALAEDETWEHAVRGEREARAASLRSDALHPPGGLDDAGEHVDRLGGAHPGRYVSGLGPEKRRPIQVSCSRRATISSSPLSSHVPQSEGHCRMLTPWRRTGCSVAPQRGQCPVALDSTPITRSRFRRSIACRSRSWK